MKLLIVFNKKKYKDLKNDYDKILVFNKNDLTQKETSVNNKHWITALNNYLKIEYKNKSILDLLQFDEFSNHWFYLRFFLNNKFNQSLYEIKKIEEYQSIYSKIDVSSDFLKTSYFEDSKINILDKQKKTKKNIKLKTWFNFFIIFFYRSLISRKLFFFKKNNIDFLLGYNKGINEVCLKQDTTKKIDIIWGIMHEKYPKEFQIIQDLNLLKGLNSNSIKLNKKYFKKYYKGAYYSEYIFFRSLFSIPVIKQNRKKFKAL